MRSLSCGEARWKARKARIRAERECRSDSSNSPLDTGVSILTVSGAADGSVVEDEDEPERDASLKFRWTEELELRGSMFSD